MSLTLHLHPLASYCWKVLIALYENDTPFRPHLVDLADEAARAAFQALWPIGRFPVLRDETRDRTVPESTIIIEYLARHYPGKVALLPEAPERARDIRLADRFYDLYVHEPMQKIVGDRLRPADARDPYGVGRARAQLDLAYGMIERRTAGPWALGEAFTMADCAAAPALHYADRVHPLGGRHPQAAAFLRRLEARPSFARVRAEAAPYDHLFPSAEL